MTTKTFKVQLKKDHTHRGQPVLKGKTIEVGPAVVPFLVERGIIDKPVGFETSAK